MVDTKFCVGCCLWGSKASHITCSNDESHPSTGKEADVEISRYTQSSEPDVSQEKLDSTSSPRHCRAKEVDKASQEERTIKDRKAPSGYEFSPVLESFPALQLTETIGNQDNFQEDEKLKFEPKVDAQVREKEKIEGGIGANTDGGFKDTQARSSSLDLKHNQEVEKLDEWVNVNF